MRIVAILFLAILALGQEVDYVTVSDNKQSNTPTSSWETARLVDAPVDNSVSETKFYATGSPNAQQENNDAIVAQEAQEEDVDSALLETQVRGPRRFVQHPRYTNLGTPIAYLKGLSPRDCMRQCEANANCAGFTVKRNGGGKCVLRSTWSGNVADRTHDSYQAIDFSTSLVDGMSNSVRTESGQQLLVLGSIQQARLPRANKAIEFHLNVDDDHSFSSTSYLSWGKVNKQKSLVSTTFHAVSLPLSKGNHKITMTRKNDDTNGPLLTQCSKRSIVSFPFPRAQGNQHWEIAGQVWNLGGTSSLSGNAFQPLPGAPMKIKFPVQSGQRVLMLADITRVEHDKQNMNSAFRFVLDGKDAGFTNVGSAYGAFKSVTLRSLSEPLQAGEHTLSVEGLTAGSGATFFNDNSKGHQQRRLTAVVIPGNMGWSKTQNPDTATGNSKTWAELPGQSLSIETINLKIPTWVVVFATISRVQAWSSENVEFRVVLDDDKVIAQHTTSDVQGWKFSDAVLQGFYLLEPGTHKVHVEYKTKNGGTVVFQSDRNGFQQRRLVVAGLGIPSDPNPIFATKGKFCDQWPQVEIPNDQ